MNQLFCRWLLLPKTYVFLHSNEFLSPKLFDLDGVAFNSEKAYRCEVDVLLTAQKHRKNSSDTKVTQK